MSKVKLVIAEGYGTDVRPHITGSEKVIDLKLEVPETHNIIGVIRTDFDQDIDGSKRTNDDLIPLVHYPQINNLVGKFLTLVDATFQDPTQRKAFKDLISGIPWDWYTSQHDSMVSPWRKDKDIFVQ